MTSCCHLEGCVGNQKSVLFWFLKPEPSWMLSSVQSFFHGVCKIAWSELQLAFVLQTYISQAESQRITLNFIMWEQLLVDCRCPIVPFLADTTDRHQTHTGTAFCWAKLQSELTVTEPKTMVMLKTITQIYKAISRNRSITVGVLFWGGVVRGQVDNLKVQQFRKW